MGAAKQRGSREERIAQAQEREALLQQTRRSKGDLPRQSSADLQFLSVMAMAAVAERTMVVNRRDELPWSKVSEGF